jgi:GntR family transcriptional regulator of arabinose operon
MRSVIQFRRPTARASLVSALSEEILRRPDAQPFPIASEHELCRRFQISRVTVRLALGDLENRGLIFRKHGKGTFAHGRATQVHRDIGFLIKTPQVAEHRPIAEMVRGAQTVMAPLRAAVSLLSRSPEEWRADTASGLAGVIVVPEGVTEKDLEVLRDRKVPYLLASLSPLAGPRIDLGQRTAARVQTERLLQFGHRQIALLSGYDDSLDGEKREGIYEALRSCGLDPSNVPEFSASGDERSIVQAVKNLLQLRPLPSGVVAFDDNLAVTLSFIARRHEGMQVPEDLSIVSFHDASHLHHVEPALATVKFAFFEAGQRAAEALNRAALTGEPVTDISLEPIYRAGQSAGPVSARASLQTAV